MIVLNKSGYLQSRTYCATQLHFSVFLIPNFVLCIITRQECIKCNTMHISNTATV